MEKRLEIPGRVTFMDGLGDMPMIEIKTGVEFMARCICTGRT